MSRKTLIKTSLLTLLFFSIPVTFLSAQQQTGNFSGNDPSSYSCYDRQGNLIEQEPIKDEAAGVFYCNTNGRVGYQECVGGVYDQGADCDARAVLNPPTIEQLQIWFVRIVYAIWAIAGTFSFLGILYIGYQYMISRGAPEATAKVKDRIAKFIIGFALIFLAVPILNTIFRLLAINDSIQCYQGLTSNVGIGFQFFFPELCTDPNSDVVVTDPCSRADASGLICNNEGAVSDSCTIGSRCVFYQCVDRVWVARSSTACPTF